MSSQPYSPTAVQPVAPRGARTPALMVLGGVLLVAGVVGGLVLLLKSTSTVEDHVKAMARAPAGCTTSLQFDSKGTFDVFVERTGRVGDLSGGCPASGSSYDRRGTELPPQTLSLVDSKDRKVGLDDAGGATYDAGGFRGTRVATVSIDDTGEYKLTVTPGDPSDSNYAIAVGKDPTAQQGTLRAAGIGALVAGVVLGGLLLVLGLRHRAPARPALATGAPTWTPGPAPAPQAPWSPQPTAPAPRGAPSPTWAAQPPPPPSPTWPPAGVVEQPGSRPDEPTQVWPPASPFAPPHHPDGD